MKDVNILIEAGVDVKKSLELFGDMETYNETLETFLEENEERVPNIKKYLDEQNMEDYAILVHAIKSDSKYLGFMSLFDIAYEHEMASKANNIDEVKNKFAELMEEIDKYTELSKKYLEGGE